MCRSFAIAILKHIEFSQGCFHIDDLNMEVDEPDALEFSYNLGNTLLKLKKEPKKKEEAKRANSRNFEELERRLANSDSPPRDQHPSVQPPPSPFQAEQKEQEREEEKEAEKEEELEEEILEYISDKDEAMPRKTQTARTVAEEIVEKYEGMEEERKEVEDDGMTEDIDFDYTETQLEDFLQSCKSSNGREPEGEQGQDKQLDLEFLKINEQIHEQLTAAGQEVVPAGADR